MATSTTRARKASPRKVAPEATTAPEQVTATVIQAFTGLKEDGRVFFEGDEFEGSVERVDELRAGGYLSEE